MGVDASREPLPKGAAESAVSGDHIPGNGRIPYDVALVDTASPSPGKEQLVARADRLGVGWQFDICSFRTSSRAQRWPCMSLLVALRFRSAIVIGRADWRIRS